MITRRRGRALVVREEPVEVEVCDSQMSPTQTLPEEELDSGHIELDDIFGDLEWTLDRDATSPLFDVDLEEFGVYGKDSHVASSASSPERKPDVKMRKNNQQVHGLNKNAIAARLNRMKKKEYVNSLECKVSGLTSENTALKKENGELVKRVEELEDETRYLRAVLANDSTLAQLLARLGGVNGVKLSSSLFQGAGSNGSDHDYAMPRKRARVEDKGEAMGGGVCLHVDRDHVSVEFCPKCSERASAALKM